MSATTTLVTPLRSPPLAPAVGAARLLVVDDNEANRDLLSRRLRRLGHEVTVATNGREALERLAAEPADLVLLDIMMPELDGYQVLERLKADETLRHVPVIMISALDDTASVVHAIKLGAEDHLSKPFEPAILRARVDACLAKKRLRDREQLHARALARELEIGRRIQASFLPESLPDLPGWRLAAHFHPARQVAGDFYDAVPLPGGPLVAVAVADVCDKGVGAALFMAIFRSLLRAFLAEPDAAAGDRAGDDPLDEGERRMRRAVAVTNDYIAVTHGRANMFATLLLGVLDPASGRLRWANCGHEPPLLRRADGTVERLPPTAPAVGLLPGLQLGVRETRLAPGDALLAYTDGVTEARAADGAFFGEERLVALLAGPATDAGALLERVAAAARDFAGDAELQDDVTMLALTREG